MKKLVPLVIGFSPLIVFSLLTKILPSGDVGVAGLVAAVLALVAMVISRPVWPPKILNSCSLVIFTALAVLGFSLDKGDKTWLATWPGGGVAIIIGAVILLLVPVIPFTEQYAKETVPREEWGSPTFKRVNQGLSLAWGASIVVIGVARVLAEAVARHSSGHHLAQILLGAVVPVIIIVYMMKFTQSYPERVAHSPA
ncbi:MAG TPA: hypothetical protein VMF65_05415 [Acidimicrobiales bacterium]|nr:hypothetical protein [Acidimicrobiales bacterium]